MNTQGVKTIGYFNWLTQRLALGALGLGLVGPSSALADREPQPRREKPEILGEVGGKSLGEWGAEWWQWVMSIPATVEHCTAPDDCTLRAGNPNLDLTGDYTSVGQRGKVWFLPGTFGETAVRTITVPHGTVLLFPVATTLVGSAVWDCMPTAPEPCDIETLRAKAKADQDEFLKPGATLYAEVDGVPVRNLRRTRAQSPKPFTVVFPPGAVFDLAAGAFGPHLTDGYWVMLKPLKPGAHQIHFVAQKPAGDFTVDVTFNITVME